MAMLLGMGFPDIDEARQALRMAKNDVNEAVAILTNEAPLSNYGGLRSSPGPVHGPSNLSRDVDMCDLTGQDGPKNQEEDFPVTNLYELDQRVFQDNWSIPYRREESLGKCLMGACHLAKQSVAELRKLQDEKPESDETPITVECRMKQNEHCRKFLDRIMPEAFKKLLSSSATHRWNAETQEGIYLMSEMLVELVTTRMEYDPVPTKLLIDTLSLVSFSREVEVSYYNRTFQFFFQLFDVRNDWNTKNRDSVSKGRWQEAVGESGGPTVDYAQPPKSVETFRRDTYGWLCDLINLFGDRGGFASISRYFGDGELTLRSMAALLLPVANATDVLVADTIHPIIGPCMDKAFNYVKDMSDADIKNSKEIIALSDLLGAIKILCGRFWPKHVDKCDDLRLDTICRMLKMPQFNSKMNALKEVSRLIEECESFSRNSSKRLNEVAHIREERIVQWMSDNRVLSVALEGNIDQVQYTERIKAIVEFLGHRLALEELTKMWNLQDSPNSQILDNVYNIMSGAASKFSLNQFEHITGLIKEKWNKSNDRIREKLLVLTGQMGREAKQIKATQAILQLLWDNAHLDCLPKILVERALSEQLAILADMTFHKDANRRTYVLHCVDDIKKQNHCVLPAVKHLHAICKSFSRGNSNYQKADKQTLADLNKQHEIVKLLSTSLKNCHQRAVKEAASLRMELTSDFLVDKRYSQAEYLEGHLDLMKFLLKEGDLYLSWSRCKILWETLVENPEATQYERDNCFEWFETCLTDLAQETQRDFFQQKLLEFKPSEVSHKGFSCFKAYFECINMSTEKLQSRRNLNSNVIVDNLDLVGLDYLWRVITDCGTEEIADEAIEYFLNMSYNFVSPRLKKDAAKLHKKFINNCYTRLEQIFSMPMEKQEAVSEGCELETSVVLDDSEDNSESRTLTAISVLKVSTLPINAR